MSKKILIIFENFGPYHAARLLAAARMLHGQCVGLELRAKSADYSWTREGCDPGAEVLSLDSTPSDGSRWTRLEHTLQQLRPDAVALPGWAEPLSLRALQWCGKTGVPAVLMAESAARDARRDPFREHLKQRIVRQFNAALVGGRMHAQYIAALGIHPNNIFLGYDAVDNDWFAINADAQRPRTELRIAAELPERYFLASARFVPKKNLAGLLRAYAIYRRKMNEHSAGTSSVPTECVAPWDLVLLGDGVLRDSLEQEVTRLGLAGKVHMPGLKQYRELPLYYAHARAFVHASTVEQWGLVVNEAMASGLPVIVSENCGCAPELVEHEGNGFTFDPRNDNVLADVMARVTRMPAGTLASFGAQSRRIVAKWGTEAFAAGLVSAVAAAIHNQNKPASRLDRLALEFAIRQLS